eukprot:scaffold3553_cov31-Prasinocladus_malaysianus.AAC.1
MIGLTTLAQRGSAGDRATGFGCSTASLTSPRPILSAHSRPTDSCSRNGFIASRSLDFTGRVQVRILSMMISANNVASWTPVL